MIINEINRCISEVLIEAVYFPQNGKGSNAAPNNTANPYLPPTKGAAINRWQGEGERAMNGMIKL